MLWTLGAKIDRPIQSDNKRARNSFPTPSLPLITSHTLYHPRVEMSHEQKYAGDLESSRDGKDIHPDSPHDLPALGHSPSYDKDTAHW
jgi:hypothetical protein